MLPLQHAESGTWGTGEKGTADGKELVNAFRRPELAAGKVAVGVSSHLLSPSSARGGLSLERSLEQSVAC